jgi:hypothetical protein
MLSGWDFTVEKDGYVFDYQKENISHYPELLKNSIDQALEKAEMYKVDINLLPGIYEFYLDQCQKSESGEVVLPRKYELSGNTLHDFSRLLIDSFQGPICKLPWQKIVMYANGDVYNCCWAKPFANIDDFDSFEDLWNCKNLQNIRSELLNGRFAPECQTPNCPSFTKGTQIDIAKI